MAAKIMKVTANRSVFFNIIHNQLFCQKYLNKDNIKEKPLVNNLWQTSKRLSKSKVPLSSPQSKPIIILFVFM